MAGSRTCVIWTNGTAIESRASGKIEVFSQAGAFPALVSVPQRGALAAWEEDGGIQIRRLEDARPTAVAAKVSPGKGKR
jgi:hypothetical protein